MSCAAAGRARGSAGDRPRDDVESWGTWWKTAAWRCARRGRRTMLAIIAGVDCTPDPGSARLTSASTATTANGTTLASSPGPRNGKPGGCSGPGGTTGRTADSAVDPIWDFLRGRDTMRGNRYLCS